jgi:hypothetical protein
MLRQILNQMNVNDKVQVDKPEQVQDFERFYLLQTKQKQDRNENTQFIEINLYI